MTQPSQPTCSNRSCSFHLAAPRLLCSTNTPESYGDWRYRSRRWWEAPSQKPWSAAAITTRRCRWGQLLSSCHAAVSCGQAQHPVRASAAAPGQALHPQQGRLRLLPALHQDCSLLWPIVVGQPALAGEA